MGRYRLPRHSKQNSLIEDRKDLKKWMKACIKNFVKKKEFFEKSSIEARAYVASTIKYYNGNESGKGLYQTGCSPNYYGKLWSLACCKHYMRSCKSFKKNFKEEGPDSEILYPKRPLFIFVFSEAHNSIEYLASISMVTQGFNQMKDYGKFLLENKDLEQKAVKSRLTRAKNATREAEKFGDCHIDNQGELHLPPSEHPHGKDEYSSCSCDSLSTSDPRKHYDNDGSHIICISKPKFWLAWDNPMFKCKPKIGRTAAGQKLKEKSFDKFFSKLDERGLLKPVLDRK